VFPPGVLNVISGDDDLGARLVAHPIPDKITFTGSVATGRRVAAAAGPQLKRVTLELGGNDAAIVLDDAPLDAISDKLFWGAFANTGQVCSAIKRLYVPERRLDAVVQALADKARSVRVGDPMEEGTQLGPVNNRPQFDRVCELVADAIASGAETAVGGKPLDRPGYFFEPTVVVGAREGVRLVDEEQFGPVLPVMPYSDVDEAVFRANNTPFGLGASVWSADVDRAQAVADQLQCGTAWVNAHGALGPKQPIVGVKASGIGCEGGIEGLYEFASVRVRYVDRTTMKARPPVAQAGALA
jgi:acyl-CoA reductase-like NAD-dependent aldehyde dehydrogenase